MAILVINLKFYGSILFFSFFAYVLFYCSMYDAEKLLYVGLGFLFPVVFLSFLDDWVQKRVDKP